MELFIVVVFIIGVVWFMRRTSRSRSWYYRYRFETGLVLLLGFFLPMALWHRAVKSRVFDSISALVSPLPNWSHPMDGKAALGVGPFMTAASGNLKLAIEQLKRLRADSDRVYIVSTELRRDSVITFYRDERHRPGWELTEDDRVALFMVRDHKQLLIMSRDDNDGMTQVVYFLTPFVPKP